jgi:xanthine dehydrogenase YagR molybdenum-binding subunit
MQTIVKAPVRIDGPFKVSGSAKYTSDYRFAEMVYAVPVGSTIAHGRIAALELDEARKMPGFVAVFHRENIGELHPPSDDAGMIDETRPPFADDVVRYYGQYVALVVAETFEQATAAAARVRVTYADQTAPVVSCDLSAEGEPKVESERGDPVAAYERADVVVDRVYVTATETHNPIELHATVALVDGDRFTIYETTQAVANHQKVTSSILGVPADRVRIITKFLGSGFGGKLWPWTHTTLAAAAAKALQRPVKLVLTRKQMFQTVGHRPRTQQRVRMSATGDGLLTSLRHEYISEGSLLDEYVENCGEATPFLYGTANVLVTSAIARRTVGTPTSMRGPGAVPGLFATELAYDELAEALAIDPIELRKRNEPALDLSLGVPFSSRHYLECLTTGADRFGWPERTAAIGSMRRDGAIVGWGMAGCTWIAARFPAQVRVELWDDGTVRAYSATQDIGTGTYTVFAQMAAQATGVPLERVVVEIGDTSLPPGPTSGGSMATASLVPALFAAVRNAARALARLVPDPSESDAELRDGMLGGIRFEQLLRDAHTRSVSGTGKSAGTFGDEHPSFSVHSYGAQFVEVVWRPEIAQLRVNRIVTVIDAGRMINARTARNQIEGALIMGVGMALLERTQYDPRSGAPINSNLADYIVATHRNSTSRF